MQVGPALHSALHLAVHQTGAAPHPAFSHAVTAGSGAGSKARGSSWEEAVEVPPLSSPGDCVSLGQSQFLSGERPSPPRGSVARCRAECTANCRAECKPEHASQFFTKSPPLCRNSRISAGERGGGFC